MSWAQTRSPVSIVIWTVIVTAKRLKKMLIQCLIVSVQRQKGQNLLIRQNGGGSTKKVASHIPPGASGCAGNDVLSTLFPSEQLMHSGNMASSDCLIGITVPKILFH